MCIYEANRFGITVHVLSIKTLIFVIIYRALQAMMYGQSIVIDCSYEEHMVWRETINAAKQMTLVFGDNRMHKDPFNIHMCNVNFNGQFMEQLKRNIPSIDEPWFPMNIHNKSYLDVFSKDKLVYLTPHCRQELTTFDHDAVYIVGCMVDKVRNILMTSLFLFFCFHALSISMPEMEMWLLSDNLKMPERSLCLNKNAACNLCMYHILKLSQSNS